MCIRSHVCAGFVSLLHHSVSEEECCLSSHFQTGTVEVSAGSCDSALQRLGRKERETQKTNKNKTERKKSERFGQSLMPKCASELDMLSWLAPDH